MCLKTVRLIVLTNVIGYLKSDDITLTSPADDVTPETLLLFLQAGWLMLQEVTQPLSSSAAPLCWPARSFFPPSLEFAIAAIDQIRCCCNLLKTVIREPEPLHLSLSDQSGGFVTFNRKVLPHSPQAAFALQVLMLSSDFLIKSDCFVWSFTLQIKCDIKRTLL